MRHQLLLMRLVIVIIAVIVGAEFLKSRHKPISGEAKFLGKPMQNATTDLTPDNAPLVSNVPITEAAYNQDPNIPYRPAFGTIEIEGTEYII